MSITFLILIVYIKKKETHFFMYFFGFSDNYCKVMAAGIINDFYMILVYLFDTKVSPPRSDYSHYGKSGW